MLKYLYTALWLIPASALSWVCPNNFNQIAAGDTVEQVQKQCGKPASESKLSKEPNVPQEWKYYMGINQPSSGTTTNSPPGATVKMTIAFVNDKAINIMVQDMSLTSTSLCGPTISTGDTTKSIEKACGKPALVQKQQNPNAVPTEVLEYKYSSAPPNTLIFEDGKLKDRK